MNKSILEVKNLSKHFRSTKRKVKAVDNISFSAKEGEIVGLLGPNGAGKTTTIMMLLDIVARTAGEIKIFGQDISSHREKVLQKMNYSSAYVELPWRLKVWEALYTFAKLYNVTNPLSRIEVLLSAFKVEQYRNTLVGDLSSGNKTRVNLCKAFINQPKLVLFDEPTAALDPEIADRVREFIKKSRNKFKTTILITSHNMAEVEELCDRVLFINKGKIIASDTPEELAKKVTQVKIRLMIQDGMKRTLAYCSRHKFSASQSGRYVTISVSEQDIVYFLSFLAEKGIKYQEISIDRPSLEDYFIAEVRHEI